MLDHAELEAPGREGAEGEKASKKDGNAKKDKCKRPDEAHAFIVAPGPDEDERSKTRTPVSDRGGPLSDIEGVLVAPAIATIAASSSMVPQPGADLESWKEQAMVQMIASFQHQVPDSVRSNMADILAPMKQNLVNVRLGQQKLENKVEQLPRELDAVRISNQSHKGCVRQALAALRPGHRGR